MRKNGFFYLGENSLEYGLRIENGLSFESPERDLDFVEIKGRDGDLVIDNQRLKMVEKSVPVTMFPVSGKNLSEQASDVSNWLKQSTGYTYIEFLNDDRYVYFGMIYEKYSMDQFLTRYGRAVLNFRMMPFKFLKVGLEEEVLTQYGSNPTTLPSKPKLTVKGHGDILIRIGKSEWSLKGVSEGIVLDTLFDTAISLNGNVSAWDKVGKYPLPKILPGMQEVKVTGNVTEVKIIPRWEALM